MTVVLKMNEKNGRSHFDRDMIKIKALRSNVCSKPVVHFLTEFYVGLFFF